MRPPSKLMPLLLAAATFAGCGASDGATAERSEPPPEVPMSGDANPDGGRTAAAGPAAAAVTDLAGRLGVDPGSIEVVESREVTWGDTSLGCPQPGMAYAQRLVNGSRVVLRAAGKDYHYHAGGGRAPFYCADPSPPVGGGTDSGGFGDV